MGTLGFLRRDFEVFAIEDITEGVLDAVTRRRI